MRRALAASLTVVLLGGCGDEDRPSASDSPDLGSSKAEQARACLTEQGFEVQGGRSSPTDRDAPDVELTLSLDGQPVFIAFYATSGEAARKESEVRKSAADFGGSVERRDSVTIVWPPPPATPARETVEQCAFA